MFVWNVLIVPEAGKLPFGKLRAIARAVERPLGKYRALPESGSFGKEKGRLAIARRPFHKERDELNPS